MKIALLGATKSGKTVYFSAVYHRFRNSISLSTLTEKKRQEYLACRINQRLGFGLRISNLELEKKLTENGERLMREPIAEEDWPPPSSLLDKASIKVRFDFAPIFPLAGDTFTLPEKQRDSLRSYYRDIEMFDPPGGVLTGYTENAEKITAQLQTCDVAIAFIPADHLFSQGTTNVDDDKWASVQHKLAWGRMVEIIENIRGSLPKGDMFPICFVLSKADCVLEHDNFVEIVNDLFYERLLVNLSETYRDFMICGCPISILDPNTGGFRAMNLEWPFLFAVGGTLMRNYRALKSDAAQAYEKAAALEARAEELEALRRRSKWLRFRQWWADGFETAGDNRRVAERYVTAAGRTIRDAEDDQRLAKDIWSAITVEGKELRGMRVLIDGKDIDDLRMGAI